jgi:hypothetical protein
MPGVNGLLQHLRESSKEEKVSIHTESIPKSGTVVGMEAKWTGLAYFDPFPDSQGIVG